SRPRESRVDCVDARAELGRRHPWDAAIVRQIVPVDLATLVDQGFSKTRGGPAAFGNEAPRRRQTEAAFVSTDWLDEVELYTRIYVRRQNQAEAMSRVVQTRRSDIDRFLDRPHREGRGLSRKRGGRGEEAGAESLRDPSVVEREPREQGTRQPHVRFSGGGCGEPIAHECGSNWARTCSRLAGSICFAIRNPPPTTSEYGGTSLWITAPVARTEW